MAKSGRKQTSLTGSLEIEEPDTSHEEGPQDGDRKYEKNNRLLGDWLDKNYRNEGTKKNYRNAISSFLGIIYPDDGPKIEFARPLNISKNERLKNMRNRRNKIDFFIDKYVADSKRVFLDDFKFCILQLIKIDYAPHTIKIKLNEIKKFFDRLNPEKYSISKRDMDDIRGSLLPSPVAVTKDEIPTKEELRSILTYLSVKNRALFLFLISTGCRIGAALQLKILDLKVIKKEKKYLDLKPREADIRAAYTKGGVGGRTVWFTPETKDALLAWLNVKDTYIKKSGDYFDKKLVFGMTYSSTIRGYHIALEKAGLDQRDLNTKLRIRKFHIHTLRKFFRTQMGDAGMPDMYTHALMGHKAYLADAYDRPRELAKTYVEYMHAVTIFEKDVDTEILEDRNRLKKRLEGHDIADSKMRRILDELGKKLKIQDMKELKTDDLAVVIDLEVEKMMKTLASNVEEIAYLKHEIL